MNTFGSRLRVSVFGASHGQGVGALLDGVPPGIPVDEGRVARRMAERRPGQPHTSARDEPDEVHIRAGIHDGATTGAPLMLWIDNVDARPQDQDTSIMRPGHADLVEHAWSRGWRDPRGGGHRSGRLTAPLVAAAAVMEPLLGAVEVGAHLVHVAGGEMPALVEPPAATVLRKASENPVPALEDAAGMAARIEATRRDGDSLGGVVAWRADHVPGLLGDPLAEAADARLAAALFAIPGVKAVSIGAGTLSAAMRGSEHNDPYQAGGGTASNHAGGIVGGRTTGMPVWGHVFVKPTPSIGLPQDAVDAQGAPVRTRVRGRHDPCVAMRAVPVVRAVVELVLADLLLLGMQQGHVPPWRPSKA